MEGVDKEGHAEGEREEGGEANGGAADSRTYQGGRIAQEYEAFRQSVLRRWKAEAEAHNFGLIVCQSCKATCDSIIEEEGWFRFEYGRLEVHHIEARSRAPEKRCDYENVAPVCVRCHRRTHP